MSIKETRLAKYGLSISVLAVLFVAGCAYATTTSWLYPTSDGTYHQWSSSPTTTIHFTKVDDDPCNTTNYVYTTGTTKLDSYGISLATLPATATVSRVDIIPCAADYFAHGISDLDVYYIWNGVMSTSVTYTITNDILPNDLATATWSGLNLSKDSSSTLEIGVRYASGTVGLRVSAMKTKLTY